MRPSALLLARAYYFLYYGAVGCYVPFINLYFSQVGLPGRVIGLLAAAPPLVMLVAGPLWGAVGDRFHIHRGLLALATLGPIVPSLLMARTGDAPLLAGLVIWSAFFSTPIIALIDSAVLDLVAGTRHSYGSVRLAGSVGFMVFTWLAGVIIARRGLPWLFVGYAVLLVAAGLIALALPARRQRREASYRASLERLLRRPALVTFLASSFLIGATLQASFSFFPLFLTGLGADPTWVGLAGSLGAISEMPVLFWSGWVIAQLGANGTALVGYLAFALRWALLAGLVSPVGALLTNLMHSVTFAPWLTGSVAFVAEHTPPGLHATAQSMLVAMSFGLGAAAGAAGGGWLYDAAGPHTMFAVAGGVALVAAAMAFAAGRQKQE